MIGMKTAAAQKANRKYCSDTKRFLSFLMRTGLLFGLFVLMGCGLSAAGSETAISDRLPFAPARTWEAAKKLDLEVAELSEDNDTWHAIIYKMPDGIRISVIYYRSHESFCFDRAEIDASEYSALRDLRSKDGNPVSGVFRYNIKGDMTYCCFDYQLGDSYLYNYYDLNMNLTSLLYSYCEQPGSDSRTDYTYDCSGKIWYDNDGNPAALLPFDGDAVIASAYHPDLRIVRTPLSPKSENVTTSLVGGKGNVTVKVGETICIKKSDYSLYPEGSLINGRENYKYADFYLYGYNSIFNGRSEYYNEDTEDDRLCYITPNTPGYYSICAMADYADPEDGDFTVSSEYFVLTVLDENGNKPVPDPIAVKLLPIASATVGESIQINWYVNDPIYPYTNTIQVAKDGNVLDTWNYYSEADRDDYTVDTAGTYQIRIIVSDGIGRTESDEMTVPVTEKKPLELKALLLRKDTDIISGEEIPDGIYWELDYEGGRGTKTSEVHLIDLNTGKDYPIIDTGFFPSYLVHGAPDGTYYLRMNVRDEDGDHWIHSNRLIIGEKPEQVWEMIMPANTGAIEDAAFQGTAVTSVKINNGCTAIGASAFADSSLTSIFIPDTVTSIGDNAIPAGTKIYTTEGSPAAKWANGIYDVVFVE